MNFNVLLEHHGDNAKNIYCDRILNSTKHYCYLPVLDTSLMLLVLNGGIFLIWINLYAFAHSIFVTTVIHICFALHSHLLTVQITREIVLDGFIPGKCLQLKVSSKLAPTQLNATAHCNSVESWEPQTAQISVQRMLRSQSTRDCAARRCISLDGLANLSLGAQCEYRGSYSAVFDYFIMLYSI